MDKCMRSENRTLCECECEKKTLDSHSSFFIMPFPAIKLVSLFIKQLSKPLAGYIKRQAQEHRLLRTYLCIPPAQGKYDDWLILTPGEPDSFKYDGMSGREFMEILNTYIYIFKYPEKSKINFVS